MTRSRYRTAAALAYDGKTMDAPCLGIKAEHVMADEIVKIARRFGIPVVEDRALAQALQQLELDQSIPEELYEAVAVVLHQLEGSNSRTRS